MRRPECRSRRRQAAERGGAVALVVLLALAGTLTGCTSARNTLGTSASSCFDALAVAEDAVHGRGTFAGVRLVPSTTLSADLRMHPDLAARFGPKLHDICAVSYRGTFDVHQVKQPLGPAPPGGVGHFAIVVVSKPQNRLIGTVVRSTQPLRFGHSL